MAKANLTTGCIWFHLDSNDHHDFFLLESLHLNIANLQDARPCQSHPSHNMSDPQDSIHWSRARCMLEGAASCSTHKLNSFARTHVAPVERCTVALRRSLMCSTLKIVPVMQTGSRSGPDSSNFPYIDEDHGRSIWIDPENLKTPHVIQHSQTVAEQHSNAPWNAFFLSPSLSVQVIFVTNAERTRFPHMSYTKTIHSKSKQATSPEKLSFKKCQAPKKKEKKKNS